MFSTSHLLPQIQTNNDWKSLLTRIFLKTIWALLFRQFYSSERHINANKYSRQTCPGASIRLESQTHMFGAAAGGDDMDGGACAGVHGGSCTGTGLTGEHKKSQGIGAIMGMFGNWRT